VRLESLIDISAGHHQLALGERPQSWREAEQAVDRASARFGAGAVRPASLVADPENRRPG
jgi:DNA polymerase-4